MKEVRGDKTECAMTFSGITTERLGFILIAQQEVLTLGDIILSFSRA